MSGKAFSNGFGSGFGGPASFATIMLKIGTVGPDPKYQDGDIIDAMNRRRCRCVHAAHICHPWTNGAIVGGLRPSNTHIQKFFERTHQYRYERIAANRIRRTNLITLDTAEFGDEIPDPEGGHIWVASYIDKRLAEKAPDNGVRKAIFGTIGSEVWYGGHIDVSHSKLDLVWNDIETHTPHREINFQQWPAGVQEFKATLLITVDDFDENTAQELVAASYDISDPEQSPVLIRKRARHIQWRNLRGMSATRISQVLDPNISVDVRAETKHVRSEHVEVKN